MNLLRRARRVLVLPAGSLEFGMQVVEAATARHNTSELIAAWSAYTQRRFEDMLSYRLRLRCTLGFHLTTNSCRLISSGPLG